MTLKILDTQYCHQGHQYELYKLPCDFYLCNSSHPNSIPAWGQGRPLRSNVKINSLAHFIRSGIKFDVIIHRFPSRAYYYRQLITKSTRVICAMQTTGMFKIPNFCSDLVWNSGCAMDLNKDKASGYKNHFIPHGFSPDEFRPLNLNRENDVMILANDFLERHLDLNYRLWHDMSKEIADKNFHIWGHQKAYSAKYETTYRTSLKAVNLSDNDIDKNIRSSKDIYDLNKIFNSYKVYFNTTKSSALPRGRAEAMMSGVPMVTTDNYDIGNFLKNKEDCILSNDFGELKKGLLDIINDEACREYYSNAARKAAVKHFHIDDFIARWMRVLES